MSHRTLYVIVNTQTGEAVNWDADCGKLQAERDAMTKTFGRKYAVITWKQAGIAGPPNARGRTYVSDAGLALAQKARAKIDP